MSENEGTSTEESGEPQQSLPQSEVDKIVAKVRAEERRKATERFKDYDELKVKAGEKQTLEERIAEMEQRTAQAVATALRSDIAAEFGISKEDRDLFLTANDEDTLRAQAKRLADRDAERKKKSPHVPKEGNVTNPNDNGEREFARQLFGRG
ncbi:MAG TPA: hypothetical protein VK028_15485 [Micromonosporaceae bacterium]|nr:hypothetical protein [Micromonosporaceae bacterium]